MASEDSRYRDRCRRFMLGDPSDGRQAVLVQVLTPLHQLEDLSELLEVGTLHGDQWVFFEERHHDAHQVRSALHGEAEERMPMVVMPGVLDDGPAPEQPLQ